MLCHEHRRTWTGLLHLVRAQIGRKWLRSNIKHGARLALLALAVQFVFAFGHFHGVAQATAAIQSGPARSVSSYAARLSAPDTISQSARQQPVSDHDSDQQPSDAC